MKKAIITSVGVDKVGITAGICNFLADNNVNIIDFSQSIKDGYYNMMVVCDVEAVPNYDDFLAGLETAATGLGIIAHCQLAEIFEAMHRI